LVVLACGARGAIDLRLDQNVVRPADHDQVFDIVAPDEHQLPLPVEAECVDQPEPRLAGPTARNAQPLSERQSVKNRQKDEGGDAANREESDLKDTIVRERKIIQPLHAQSKVSALGRATKNSSKFACRMTVWLAPETQNRPRPHEPPRRPHVPNPFRRAPV